MEWYLKVIRDNYANFEGRARRKEYWMFTLIHILIIFALSFLSGLLSFSEETALISSGLIFLYIIATLIPGLAVTVRRLHDTGKSGWFYLLALIPYVGGFIILIFTIMEGDIGTNKYGPDPKRNFEEIDDIGKSLNQ